MKNIWKIIIALPVAVVLISGGAIMYTHFHGRIIPIVSSHAFDEIPSEQRTISDPVSTSTFPYITKYHDAVVLKKVNDQLSKLVSEGLCSSSFSDTYSLDDLRSELAQGYGTDKTYTKAQIARMTEGELMKALNWEADTEASTTYAKNDIFSFTYTYDSYCGGAHPDNGEAGATFDMKTGKLVQFKDLLEWPKKDHDAIVNILYADYKKEYESTPGYNPKTDSTCPGDLRPENGYSDNFDPEYVSYFISDKGLTVIPSLPHVIEACSLEIPVPLAQIQPYLAKDSILNRMH
jgi:hypothetical protein